MKLTWENNRGDKVIVTYNKECITDDEVRLDPNMALEPMWESLKAKIVEEYELKQDEPGSSRIKEILKGLKKNA